MFIQGLSLTGVLHFSQEKKPSHSHFILQKFSEVQRYLSYRPRTTFSTIYSQSLHFLNKELINKIFLCFVKFLFGAASIFLSAPCCAIAIQILTKYNLIPPLDTQDMFSECQEKLQQIDPLLQFDREKIFANKAPIAEFVRQINHYKKLVTPEEPLISVFNLKMGVFKVVALKGPIFEELFFRQIIQTTLLLTLPKYIAKKYFPSTISTLDSKIYTVVRIIFTCLLFTCAHLANLTIFPTAYVIGQLVCSCILGIHTGIIRESSIGISGAIGAHIANNTLALSSFLLSP